MAKFVTLPQHWNKKPVSINIDKICVVEHSAGFTDSAHIILDGNFGLEVNMPFDELMVLLNNTKE